MENVGSLPHSLPFSVMEAMRPVFQDLAGWKLLHKCLHSQAENPIENMNNQIGTLNPKTSFVSVKILHSYMYEYDAVAMCNRKSIAKCHVIIIIYKFPLSGT
jgi:hypothetical protein